MRKRYLLSVAGGCVLTATLVINAVPVNAQVGNYGYGSSTAAGSGGLPTESKQSRRDLWSELFRRLRRCSDRSHQRRHIGIWSLVPVPAPQPPRRDRRIRFCRSSRPHGWGSQPRSPSRRARGRSASPPGSDGDSWGREQLARHAWKREQRIGDRSCATFRGRTIGRGGPIGWRGSIGRHGRISRHGPIGRHRRERTVTLLNHLNDTDYDAFAQFSIVNT